MDKTNRLSVQNRTDYQGIARGVGGAAIKSGALAATISGRVFRPLDDLVLKRPAQVAEVVAVAGDAYYQIAVIIGMGLRLA